MSDEEEQYGGDYGNDEGGYDGNDGGDDQQEDSYGGDDNYDQGGYDEGNDNQDQGDGYENQDRYYQHDEPQEETEGEENDGEEEPQEDNYDEEQEGNEEDNEVDLDDEKEEAEDEAEERRDDEHVEDEEEWNGEEEAACGFSNNAEGDGGSECAGAATAVKGVFDGFGGGGISGIISNISSMAGGSGGGLTNILSSGGLESIVEKMVGECAHRFIGVNPETGAIIGAIAGNIIFNMGGRGNSLGSIGKVILDNIISGKFRRDIHPFVPPVPTPGASSFGLNFIEERDKCLREHRLFEDPEFPAADRSLYFKTPPEQHIQWLRPGEIVSDPQLIVGEKSRFDVKQGALGDCWLLAAVANLTLRDEMFYRVVPPDQSFTENYAGIFHFQFWRYGKWIDVVIDDKLPCVDGKLCYMHSHEHNEFWSALLEKAYAKLYGSYENLEGGTTAEALEDFTGGLTEFFDLRKADKATILAMMVRGFQMGSLFGCSIDADPNQKEAPLENGLVRGHAYSITALETVNVNGTDIPLVRIRNPWGNSKEWNGPWSDSSSEWYSVSEDQKQKMGVTFSKDGEFWMSFDDFCTNYHELEICNMSAQIMDEVSQMTGIEVAAHAGVHQWDEKQQDGEWSSSHGTAGGCTNHPDTYANNPQYGSMFTVTQDSVEQDGKCTVIVAVLQKYRRELRTAGKDSLPIGFAVYDIGDHSGPLPADFFHGKRPVARTKVFINMREVTSRFRARPGQYVIVPCTFDPDCDGEFLLRIYANGALQAARLR